MSCLGSSVVEHSRQEWRFKSHLRFFFGKMTVLGVLCCFALLFCLILLASFFLPSHLSLTCTIMCNLFYITHTHTLTHSHTHTHTHTHTTQSHTITHTHTHSHTHTLTHTHTHTLTQLLQLEKMVHGISPTLPPPPPPPSPLPPPTSLPHQVTPQLQMPLLLPHSSRFPPPFTKACWSR